MNRLRTAALTFGSTCLAIVAGAGFTLPFHGDTQTVAWVMTSTAIAIPLGFAIGYAWKDNE